MAGRERSPGDPPGFRLFRLAVGAMEAPHIHDQVEVMVVESGRIVHEQCVRTEELRAGDLAAFWAAFPHRTD